MFNEIETGRRAMNLSLPIAQLISGVYQSPELMEYVGSSAPGSYAANISPLNTNLQAKEAEYAES
jgi:hypothetical protein